MRITKLLLFSLILVKFAFSAELKRVASDASFEQKFGHSVSIFQDNLAIGAFGDIAKGAVYIFNKDQGGFNNWGQLIKKTASDGVDFDQNSFGYTVSLFDTILAVGAPKDDHSDTTDAGSAYIFYNNAGGPDNWGEVIKIFPPDTAAGDSFGFAVSISDTILAIGAPQDDHIATNNAGSVYIFYKNEGGVDNWGFVTKIIASDAADNDVFGYTVAIDGNNLIVGSTFQARPAGVDQGAVYFFSKDEGGTDNWGEIVKRVPTLAGRQELGYSVAINGDYAVAGATAEDSLGERSGSAYVYFRDQGGTNNWGLQTKLKALDIDAGDGFGNSVAIYDNFVLIGSWRDSLINAPAAGSAYSFIRQGSIWTQRNKITASDSTSGDLYGIAVSLNNDFGVIGSGFDNHSGETEPGSVYIYDAISDLALPVYLSSLTAQHNYDLVLIEWETQSELDNVGFIVYKSDNEFGPYFEISSYKNNAELKGLSNSSTGRIYSFNDTSIDPYNTYWYKIADVSITGKINEHGPVKVSTSSIPTNFSLIKSFPNPFNPVTNILINLKKDEKNIDMVIYNSLGQRIKTIYSGNLNKGTHNFIWNSNNEEGNPVASGMYILSLKNKNTMLKNYKLILIR